MNKRKRKSITCWVLLGFFHWVSVISGGRMTIMSRLVLPSLLLSRLTVNVSGKELSQRPTFNPGAIVTPVGTYSIDASPDGKWLSCWSSDENTGALVLWMSPTSKPSWKKIAYGVLGNWSPDSHMYAFSRGTFQKPQLALVRTTSLKATLVDTGSDYTYGPTWSPDGKQLAVFAGPPKGSKPHSFNLYEADNPLYRRLLLLRSNGKLSRAIPIAACRPSLPVWSPNQSKIAYASLNAMGQGGVRVLDFRTRSESAIPLSASEDDLAWINSEWIQNGSASWSTRLRSSNTLFQGDERKGQSTQLEGLAAAENGRFYVVLSRPQRQGNSVSELWLGSTNRVPRLTLKYLGLSLANTGGKVVSFSSRAKLLWILVDGKAKRISL